MNMKNYLSSYILVMFLIATSCQLMIPEDDFNIRKSMSEGDTLHLFSTLDEPVGSRFDADKIYYSFRFGKIRSLQGGIDGEPLQGKYELFFKKQPLQKGTFRNGLKNGQWYTWSEKGILVSVIDYRMGYRHGIFRQYDENGDLSFQATNKKGQLEGIAEINNGDDQLLVKYEDGIVTDTISAKSKAFRLFKKNKDLSEE